MLQHIISNSHQCIFLSIHRTILAEQGQTVHVRVNHKCNIMTTLLHQILNVTQILLQRFRVMLKIASRFCIKAGHLLNTKLLQQLRQNNTAYRVHTVNSHLEMSITDSLHINQFQVFHHVNVFLVIRMVLTIMSQMIYVRIFKGLLFSNTQHLVSLFLIQKLTMLIKQFKGIPHSRVM